MIVNWLLINASEKPMIMSNWFLVRFTKQPSTLIYQRPLDDHLPAHNGRFSWWVKGQPPPWDGRTSTAACVPLKAVAKGSDPPGSIQRKYMYSQGLSQLSGSLINWVSSESSAIPAHYLQLFSLNTVHRPSSHQQSVKAVG